MSPKEAKRLYKKYKQLPNDLIKLSKKLTIDPKAGINFGNNCYKIRLSNSSIPTGKSGGFRIIYYYYDDRENHLYLMTIFSKKDMESIKDETILKLVEKYEL